MNKTSIFLVLVISILTVFFVFSAKKNKESIPAPTVNPLLFSEYNPQINPTDFTFKITNKYFSLPVGRKLVYQSQTSGGTEKIEIEIESATKEIMGVKTTIYRDKVYLNNTLVEDTRDYLAQDKEGNVWYFGEEVDNYEDGKLIDHTGSFIAGEDRAKPGIWIKAVNIVGDSYRQEYYPDEAEDVTDVVATGQTVIVGDKTYTGCVKMYDWTPLDDESKEYKYYCPEVSAMVLVEDLSSGEKTELLKIN